jgi:hypothetical protein
MKKLIVAGALALAGVAAFAVADAKCDGFGCVVLVWKDSPKSDCSEECASACEGGEVNRATDLQTNCECDCSGGSTVCQQK